MEKDIEIPSDVVDKEAYLESLRLASHKIIRNPIYITSEGVELSLAQMVHILRKKIEHLPQKEIDKIEKLKAVYFKINNNLTIQKRKAFGRKQGAGVGKTENGTIFENRKEELLEYFGRMFTVEEVIKIVNDSWGLPVGKSTLYAFKVKYAEEIKKRIDVHQVSFHNIRLGVKKSRMEELSEIYRRQKEIWEEGEKRDDLRIVLNILEQFRKEAEGDRLTIEGKVDVKYEQNIQVHLMKEVFATTNLKEIILGRVAAKMGINPIKLITSLQNSYYKQHSNVLGDFDENESNGDLPYPSQLNYDFERIGKNFLLRDKQIEEAVVLDEQMNTKDLEKALSLKDKIAAKLKAKNAEMKNMQNKLDIMDDVKRSQKEDERLAKIKKRKETAK